MVAIVRGKQPVVHFERQFKAEFTFYRLAFSKIPAKEANRRSLAEQHDTQHGKHTHESFAQAGFGMDRIHPRQRLAAGEFR